MGQKRFYVRTSEIHGRGVFAAQAFQPGDWLMHYGGRLVDEEDAQAVMEALQEGFTMLVHVGSDDQTNWYRDGQVGGTSARFLNHSCSPNCQLVSENWKAWVQVLRPVQAGEELTLRYDIDPSGLERSSWENYACRCGEAACSGTMLER